MIEAHIQFDLSRFERSLPWRLRCGRHGIAGNELAFGPKASLGGAPVRSVDIAGSIEEFSIAALSRFGRPNPSSSAKSLVQNGTEAAFSANAARCAAVCVTESGLRLRGSTAKRTSSLI